MDQSRSLKFSAIAFGVLWSAFMVWWSGEYHPVNIIILAVCGAIGAVLWYWIMGRSLRWIAARKSS